MADISIQDLEDLQASKGWHWLMQEYQREWGADAFLDKLRKIADETVDPAIKAAKTEQAWAGRLTIEGFLRRPEGRIHAMRAQLRSVTTTDPMSRRGPGL